MRPPRNPLAGNRAGETSPRRRRGFFIPKYRTRRRPGDRARHVADASDRVLRDRGVPIYDDAARAGELGSYLAPRH